MTWTRVTGEASLRSKIKVIENENKKKNFLNKSIDYTPSVCPVPTIYSKSNSRRNFKFIGHGLGRNSRGGGRTLDEMGRVG